MKEFRNKVAVVTGAASGIGRALADRCMEEGMKLVLADVEQGALARTESELKSAGAEVLAVRTDVSKAAEVASLAQRTLDSFGGAHLLFNNAGVAGAGATIWEATMADWEWTLGVNLWGVIHGMRAFVPIMLAQNAEAHIVNTASVYGLIASPGAGIYKLTKHAVVSLSETLWHELAAQNARVRVSVLCPGYTNTRILDSMRNRPTELQNDPASIKPPTPEQIIRMKAMREMFAQSMSPEQVADCVFEAVRSEQFYILPESEWKAKVQRRTEHIVEGTRPDNGLL